MRIRRAGYPVKCAFGLTLTLTLTLTLPLTLPLTLTLTLTLTRCAFGQIVNDFSELHIPGW